MGALGAVVQAIAFPELYLALAQKVVDGEENPIAVIYYNKFYEVQKRLAITRHIYNNLWTSPAQGDLLGSAGMHESIRPVAGRLCAPGLDGSPLLLAS
jgi:extracellular solute-binding protein (family 7)